MEEDTSSPVPWRHMVRMPEEWAERVERLADEQGVPVAVMLRLLVHAGLERWEAWMDARACKGEDPCPDCGGPFAAPAPAVVRALVQEYADVLARRGAWEKPAILGQAEQYCYLHGVYHALERVAERIGITDLHARATAVVARGEAEEGHDG